MLRELALGFAGLLHTLDGSQPDDAWTLHAGSQELYDAATPDNHTYHNADGKVHLPCYCVPHVKKLLFGRSPVHNTAGTRGAWTHPTLNVTVRAFSDMQRAVHWPHIRNIVRGTGGHRHGTGADEVILVGLGIHDTNKQISETVRDSGERWKHDPLAWTHGPVFDPFLQHWCDTARQMERRDVRTPGGRCTGAGESGNAPGQPPLPWPPLMWVTPYRQCKEKKPRKWRYQAAVMAAASAATLAASAREGVPVLDLSQIMGEAAADVCQAMPDGVHVHKWADHVIASLLLTYLCSRHGSFEQPCVRTDRIARRCAERQQQNPPRRSPQPSQ